MSFQLDPSLVKILKQDENGKYAEVLSNNKKVVLEFNGDTLVGFAPTEFGETVPLVDSKLYFNDKGELTSTVAAKVAVKSSAAPKKTKSTGCSNFNRLTF